MVYAEEAWLMARELGALSYLECSLWTEEGMREVTERAAWATLVKHGKVCKTVSNALF